MTRFLAGERAATDRWGEPIPERFAIRDTQASHHDIRIYSTESERDAALTQFEADPSLFRGDLTSQEHGGNWAVPPVWREQLDTDAIIQAEFPGVRDEAATAKLRELIRERNALRQAQVDREVTHAEQVDSLRVQLNDARAPIDDVSDERLTPIWDKAEKAASDAGFCSEYDRLCDLLGVPGRLRLRRSIVRVELNMFAYSEARSDAEAQAAMEHEVREALHRLETEDRYTSHGDGSISHVDLDSIEVEDAEVYE